MFNMSNKKKLKILNTLIYTFNQSLEVIMVRKEIIEFVNKNKENGIREEIYKFLGNDSRNDKDCYNQCIDYINRITPNALFIIKPEYMIKRFKLYKKSKKKFEKKQTCKYDLINDLKNSVNEKTIVILLHGRVNHINYNNCNFTKKKNIKCYFPGTNHKKYEVNNVTIDSFRNYGMDYFHPKSIANGSMNKLICKYNNINKKDIIKNIDKYTSIQNNKRILLSLENENYFDNMSLSGLYIIDDYVTEEKKCNGFDIFFPKKYENIYNYYIDVNELKNNLNKHKIKINNGKFVFVDDLFSKINKRLRLNLIFYVCLNNY